MANAKALKPINRYREDDLFKARERICERLAQLPKGTIKERLIAGRKYYYLQRREGKKVIHAYIGRAIPKVLKRRMEERKALRAKLMKTQDILMTFLSARIKNILR